MNNKFIAQILVFEDNSAFAEAVASELGGVRHYIFEALSPFLDNQELANGFLKQNGEPDLILVDLCHAADPSGEKTIRDLSRLRALCPNSEIIIESSVEEVSLMRQALAAGASRFLSKDQLLGELGLLAARAGQMSELRKSFAEEFVGQTSVIQNLRSEILRLRFDTRADVLIEGETGSGKELCARWLHADGPFIAVNCSAIPPDLFEAEFFGAEKGSYTGASSTRTGFFESAGAGVLFLDEIQSLPLVQQAKLLRVLETRRFMRVGSSQERAFAGRVVSAANVRLKEAAAKGLFREDLYYRISAVTLSLPPLRVRRADIPLLLKKFFDRYGLKKKLSLSSDALQWLSQVYDWPGNVRELAGFVKRMEAQHRLPVAELQDVAQVLGVQMNLNSRLAEPESDVLPVAATSSLTSVPSEDFLSSYMIDWTTGLDANLSRLEKMMLDESVKKMGTSRAKDFLKLGKTRFYEKLREYNIATKL